MTSCVGSSAYSDAFADDRISVCGGWDKVLNGVVKLE